jgi:hypothetical protein
MTADVAIRQGVGGLSIRSGSVSRSMRSKSVRPRAIPRGLNGQIAVLVAAAAVSWGVPPALAAEETSKSAGAVQALTKALTDGKLQYVAARDPSEENRFVAAMHFPGVQLLVVSGKYSAPALLNEKLIQGHFQDVYVDLNSASDRATRVIIEDLFANGLARQRLNGQPPDAYEAAGKRVSFDADWRRQKLTQDEYAKLFLTADEQYTRLIGLLLEEARRGK